MPHSSDQTVTEITLGTDRNDHNENSDVGRDRFCVRHIQKGCPPKIRSPHADFQIPKKYLIFDNLKFTHSS